MIRIGLVEIPDLRGMNGLDWSALSDTYRIRLDVLDCPLAVHLLLLLELLVESRLTDGMMPLHLLLPRLTKVLDDSG